MVRQHHQFNGHEFQQTPVEKDREAWHAAVHESQRVRGDLVTEQQQKDRKKLYKKESINQQKEK